MTTEALQGATSDLQAWLRTVDHPFGWVNDPSALTLDVVASQRKLLADHLRVIEPMMRRYCAGMSIVVTSPAIRGAATAVGWLCPFTFPTAYHATLDEAMTWLHGQLSAPRASQ